MIPSAPKAGSPAGIGVVAAQYAAAQHMAAHNSVTMTRRSSSVCDCLGPRKRYTSVVPGSLDVVVIGSSPVSAENRISCDTASHEMTRFLSNANQNQAVFCL